MARVAAELGFTTMSLYRYVASKEELLQLMWNGSARGADSLVLEGDGWRARLRMWAIVQRDMIDRHPWITQMPMAAPPMAPNSMIFVERGLETMDGTPLADADKLRFIGLISSYTLSEARMANDERRAEQEQGAPAWTYDALLRELADEATYPRLHKIAWTPPAPAPPPATATAGRSGRSGRAGRRRSARSSCSGSTASWTASRPTWTGPGRRPRSAGVRARSPHASLGPLWLRPTGLRASACAVRVVGCPLQHTMRASTLQGRPQRNTMMTVRPARRLT